MCIGDIAHSLSNQCRFTGHTRTFYSVAQHSVLVSRVCSGQDALWGLLHDASEAYLTDFCTPLKSSPQFGPYYYDVEADLMEVICRRFGLPLWEPDSVTEADKRLLVTEQRDLMGVEEIPDWPEVARTYYQYEPLEQTITPWSPRQSEARFLSRFQKLTGGKN